MEPALLKRERPRDEHGELLSDQWETPDGTFKAICEGFGVKPEIDVCASSYNTKCKFYITRKMDALKTDWIEFARLNNVDPIFWMNPPYSSNLLAKFVAKAHEESQRGGIVAMILPASVSTNWYHKYIAPLPEPQRYFKKGRVAFRKHPLMDHSKKDAPSGGNLIALFLPPPKHS